MPHFVGDTHRNCKVYVDYVKDTVVFEPVGKASILSNWVFFVLSIWTVLVVPIYTFYIVGMLLIIVRIGWPVEGNRFFDMVNYYSYQLLLPLIFIFIFPIVCSLPYLIKRWRKNYYPAFMATIDIFSNKRKVLTANSDAIIDNKYIIPLFMNVMLKYELTGDFAKTIESVKIENLF